MEDIIVKVTPEKVEKIIEGFRIGLSVQERTGKEVDIIINKEEEKIIILQALTYIRDALFVMQKEEAQSKKDNEIMDEAHERLKKLGLLN